MTNGVQEEDREDGKVIVRASPVKLRCGMWLESKRRFCASPSLPNSVYCGNHSLSMTETRVPCPVDSSHTVFTKDVTAHVLKCSATKQRQKIENQPHFCRGLNAGSDGEDSGLLTNRKSEVPNAPWKCINATAMTSMPLNVCHECGDDGTLEPANQGNSRDLGTSRANKLPAEQIYQSCGSKRAAICALVGDQLTDFLKRIEYAHNACCQESVDISVFQPPECSKWWDSDRDRRLPFKEKHAVQQASLLGNLQAYGLLPSQIEDGAAHDSEHQKNQKDWVYIEFGAGRGYLSHMLCDCYGVSSLVLVERRSYKFKADRTLRQSRGVSVERIRIDIEDLDLQGVTSLHDRHFVAISKHLCGPATDLTLRCCIRKLSESSPSVSHATENMNTNSAAISVCSTLEGIGIATCCHHLCQWKSYVNKDLFLELGFTIQEFQMITWLTSWAISDRGQHDGGETEESRTVEINGSPDHLEPRLSDGLDAFGVQERVLLGSKCKHLLDYGRLCWLRKNGMDAKLVEYIASSVSPENKCLLAWQHLSVA